MLIYPCVNILRVKIKCSFLFNERVGFYCIVMSWDFIVLCGKGQIWLQLDYLTTQMLNAIAVKFFWQVEIVNYIPNDLILSP